MSAKKPRFGQQHHIDALIKRRIKGVVEKGAMARLFKKGQNQNLQAALKRRIDIRALKRISSCRAFDRWHREIVRHRCWNGFARESIRRQRWGHFAKLVNIVVYELVSSNEIVTLKQAKRLRRLIHLPIDRNVLELLGSLKPGLCLSTTLSDMTERRYRSIQQAIREEARRLGIPAIWFEDAWVGR